jgi:capsular polysaccharide biosynthesis protein
MEFKEYLKIFKRHIKLFVAIIVAVVLGTFAYFIFRSESWATSLSLNITRAGTQETPDFKYDDFYRLQADEKFAETVVEWLKNPRVVYDIYSDAGVYSKNFTIGFLSKSFRSEKLSSQMVSVNFSSPDEKTARKTAQAIAKTISQNTENLNRDQKENTWFEIIAHDPIIMKRTYEPENVLFLSLLAGIFLGFWVVMVRHYWE